MKMEDRVLLVGAIAAAMAHERARSTPFGKIEILRAIAISEWAVENMFVFPEETHTIPVMLELAERLMKGEEL